MRRPKPERAASGQHNRIGALHKSPRLQEIQLSRPRSRPSHLGGTQGRLIERDDGATRLRGRKGRVPDRDAFDVPNNPGCLYHVAVTPGKAMVMRPVKCSRAAAACFIGSVSSQIWVRIRLRAPARSASWAACWGV